MSSAQASQSTPERNAAQLDDSALVIGATGTQGSAVARALLRSGSSVTALVRDPQSENARHLRSVGARLVVGSLDDPASLSNALQGQRALFSMQPAPHDDRLSERRQAHNLIQAAERSGVEHVVHSSVSGTGWRLAHPQFDPGVMTNYWDSKESAEETVRESRLPYWTILKPAFMMENFIRPKVDHMFPHLSSGEIVLACSPDTVVALVSARDIGRAVVSALATPATSASKEIELASHVPTFSEIAAAICGATGQRVRARQYPVEEADARYGRVSWTAIQRWLEEVGYPARPHHAGVLGFHPSLTIEEFLANRSMELR